mgnify:FL=1
MIYLELFWSFFQIGLFSIGGGYAAMPLIQNQVVDIHPWLTMTGFADIMAIAEMTPGPIAVNAVCWYSGGGSAGGTDCHDRLYFPVLRHRHDAGLRVLPFPRSKRYAGHPGRAAACCYCHDRFRRHLPVVHGPVRAAHFPG